jgi:hypothetical protein
LCDSWPPCRGCRLRQRGRPCFLSKQYSYFHQIVIILYSSAIVSLQSADTQTEPDTGTGSLSLPHQGGHWPFLYYLISLFKKLLPPLVIFKLRNNLTCIQCQQKLEAWKRSGVSNRNPRGFPKYPFKWSHLQYKFKTPEIPLLYFSTTSKKPVSLSM